MNNDPSPTLPAHHPLLPNQHHGAENDTHSDRRQSPVPGRRQHDSAGSQSPPLSPSAKEGLAMKLQFLMHLSLNLDTLAYAELLPNYHISAIVAPNLLCMFLHLISSPLEAGEASRGYLHGGILVDFIGQKAPSTRFTLILLDAAVLAIQCFMVTVNIEKERIRNVIKPPRVNTSSTGIAIAIPTTTQDHDSEERGVLRDAPEVDDVNETDNVEMRSLGNYDGDGSSDGEIVGGEGSRLFGRSEVQRTSQSEDLTDVLQSGNAIIGNFHIPQSLRTAWHSTGSTPESAAAYALQNVGYNATLAALAAQRRARLTATQQRQP
ncbi:hypothetical protein FHL15_008960 [Xylaria flabelliformis]|uniref:DUF1746 domain-containing protein n=1 Tax=Xylaria flabelliformis TaxID=2512241 RepID=A0A553HQJ6_9PEZI|nr:hypothetical protein FHL15_008960 [Xylaria flabelliformis]